MEKHFKFKSLNIYASDEWMADSTKRYRQVFDKAEVNYLRCELAIFNKLFDEEDWNAKVILRCINVADNIEQCKLEADLQVKKEDNIAYVRDGWGVEIVGGFWQKGKYRWIALVDGIEIGTQDFFVEDIGLVTNYSNPYFSIESIKLFHGDFEGWKQTERRYFTTFNKNATNYI